MQEEIQSNHLLMWLHQSTLRILVMLNHFLKCNMLPRPVLNENVACVQEKVFFFSWVIIWRNWHEKGFMQFPTLRQTTQSNTEDGVCVFVCVYVGVMHNGGVQGNPHSPES